jgi:tetratricopeptide (TPR) repeat protein
MIKWVIFIAIFSPLNSKSQVASRNKSAQEVYKNLIQAFANGKGAPDLKIIPLNGRQVIAEYTTLNEIPFIQIDQKLINICFSLEKDSLNALAFILAHELSHYYRDDNWCMDYAALKFKINPAFAKEIKNGEKFNKSKEIIADKEGIIYANIAGYKLFNIFNRLVDSVYSVYSLQSNLSGYPTKNERKNISLDASVDAKKWLSTFNRSIQCINEGNYKVAIDSLSYLSQKFPSREVYNNLGVAKVRKALLLKPKTYEEVNFPNRFLYPIEIENKTRLSQDDTRGIDEKGPEVMTQLLRDAKKDFQEAIRIDPSFINGHINLACVFDLLDNPFMAIGIIKQMPLYEQNSDTAKRILAISYYYNNEKELAEKIWTELKILK